MNFAEDFLKCSQNFGEFVKYLYVNHYKHGLIQYNYYPFHKRLCAHYEENNNNLVVKFRQGGFSTFYALYSLWKCLFNKRSFLFVCKSDRESIYLTRIIQIAIDHFPEEFKCLINKINDHYVEFRNGSKIYSRGVSATRGIGVTDVIIEEAAFIQEDVYKAVFPCSFEKITISSTPNGENWFYKMYKNSSFKVFEVSHKECPDYPDDKFLIENLGVRGFAYEILCQFAASVGEY